VVSGIADLMIAYSAGPAQPDEDRIRLVEIYAETVAEFDALVAEHSLKRLLRWNPRNPFRPTPHDAYAACKSTNDMWISDTAVKFHLGSEFDLPRAECAAPDGATLPMHLERAYLRLLLKIALGEIHRGSGSRHTLVIMREDQFAMIPAEAFPEGGYAMAQAARQKFDEERARRRAREAA
jgi:hypothetical protein